jgi:hypothetical protein
VLDGTPRCFPQRSRRPPSHVPFGPLRAVTTFSTKGSRAHLRRATPTAGTGNASWREQPGESRAAGGPAISGKVRRGLAVAGRQLRRALRAEALRRDELPRTAAPAPAAAGPRRHAPVPRHTSRAKPSRSRRVRRSPCERSQPPGRNVAHYPGRPLQRQGHPKILSNRFAERIFGTRP